MQLIQRERKIKGKGGCLEMERESCLSHKVRFDKTQPLPRPRPMPDRTSRSSAAGMLPEVVRCSADNTATGDVRRDDVARWPRRRTNEHRRKPRHTNGGLIRTLEAVQAGTSEHGTEAPKGSLVHNPEIFVREIQTLRTLVRHFHTGAILKSHTAVHIFSYENPEITYTEQEKY